MPQRILEFENRSIGAAGEPTLGRALEVAASEWHAGNRDRELRLHLIFHCWYCSVEPPHLTGFKESHVPSSSLLQLCQDAYRTFEDSIDDDVECLYVIGLMAQIAPWCLGEDVAMWQARAVAFQERYRFLAPNGLSSALFEGRGAYGHYFSHQLSVAGGF